MNTLPPWIKKRLSSNRNVWRMKEALAAAAARTVCESSLCPNLNDCFSRSRATFLILGDICTRACAFCAARNGEPSRVDPLEADRIVAAMAELEMDHVVITSVTRDDLGDGGAGQFADVIEKIRRVYMNVKIEVLVPDLGGRREAVRRVVSAGPDIFGHNIETVPRLYGTIRPGADYTRSLEVLRWAGEFACGLPTKSSILLGFGEEEWEVVACMKDLRRAGCGILAIGQYLRPTRRHIRVARFIPPEEFAHYEDLAYGMGFKAVSSGPFVRSSYQSADKYQ